MPSQEQQPKYLLIGVILRPHGVIGELRMKVITSYPERISGLKTLFLADSPNSTVVTQYALERVRMHQEYALLKFKGIDDRDQANLLRQLFVMVAIEDAIPLDEGELYLYQLIGMTVQTDEGETIGSLTEVLETGANDVYVVDSPQYGEVLVPATDQTIISTDTTQRIITIHVMEGLLPSR